MAKNVPSTGADRSVGTRAQDAAGNVPDKAKEGAGHVAMKAKDVAPAAGDKADGAVSSVGSGMQSLAGAIRDKGPSGGILGGAASGVAGALDSGGQYLEQHGLSGVAGDVTNLIRQHPVPALLLGVGLGYVLARITRR
jgi:hypothetical protein